MSEFGFRSSGILPAIEELKSTLDRADTDWDQGTFIYSANIDMGAASREVKVKMHIQWPLFVKIVDTYGLHVTFEDYTCSTDKYAEAKFNDWLTIHAWASVDEVQKFKEEDR